MRNILLSLLCVVSFNSPALAMGPKRIIQKCYTPVYVVLTIGCFAMAAVPTTVSHVNQWYRDKTNKEADAEDKAIAVTAAPNVLK